METTFWTTLGASSIAALVTAAGIHTVRHYWLGLVAMLGINLHSFIDGFVYSITFTVEVRTRSQARLTG